MKKLLLSLSLVLVYSINAFSQATSLTVDCQTPGWLSGKIEYGDQQTLKNIKVTGYINTTDLKFIRRLNYYQSLSGVIDLEDVVIVKEGTLNKDSMLPEPFMSSWKHMQKFVYPKSLIAQPSGSPKYKSEKVDSIIWTSNMVKELYLGWFNNDLSDNCDYISLPEGVERITDMPDNIKITFPKSLNNITEWGNNLTIYSFIDNPEAVNAKCEIYTGSSNGGYYSYWAAISNSTFYIPKGTREKYLKSDFATMKMGHNDGTSSPNGNIFVEYYDVDSTIVSSPSNIYVGDTLQLDVKVYPDANLVSWIDYANSFREIVDIISDGTIIAKKCGVAEISATPHVFIDGLETKTGRCIINVIAHTEGVEVPSTFKIHIGERKNLNARTLPLGITDNMLLYESSDPSVAEVNEEGIIIGHKKSSCIITATSVDGGYTAKCEVTVTQPVEAMSLEKHSLTLKVGDNERIFTQISPANADDKSVTWSSSDKIIASVDANGNVTAKKAGETWIKAVSQDNPEAKDSCLVTVNQPVLGISLNHKTYELGDIGESFELIATIAPDDASNKNVKWTCSNESVCIVSRGIVVGVGYGTAVIIANTEDGGYLATCTVNVVNTTGISSLEQNGPNKYHIYNVNGAKLTRLQKGINFIRFADGTSKKVSVK